ncbi:PIG-L family deacetylase [Cryobacterium sp. TMT1-21]|uniref:PIG-L family deacetylase n=1 Tax=Cryobacterium shii TaxID=1259235 RepID=A0AAQ2C569_9MICO|nr:MULTISPECIES: PIG-L deacetylase family protein [Cryobacterium]TFC44393.1 PIG-L family deacetylase [Cryobacterium shii]TFC88463.1 PIG-L family deacetylase [Cryobacterium sp. TmT2-59]TFD11945.1 PIG-L family deacetylase [Cryobacterium sp. TMT1-21]TFD18939.1 PIG-L family deacetylase [Cryobacterium sp. TMT2-23]TFD20971.1 PIG-L family deacetylase [Cryobacterium sp. TMT4-10]
MPHPTASSLPTWSSVLVVVAHPDDESFGLGAILNAFSGAGAGVDLLCFTQGEASTLHGVPGDLAQVRKAELDAAASALGVQRTTLRDYADGALDAVNLDTLAAEVVAAAESARPDGLLVFDDSGVTGHPDHVAATAVALAAAETLNLPVLGWTLPGSVALDLNREYGAAFTGHPDAEIDLRISVDRERQHAAIQAHASQAVPGSVLWRRLELLGDAENLRWLRPPT